MLPKVVSLGLCRRLVSQQSHEPAALGPLRQVDHRVFDRLTHPPPHARAKNLGREETVDDLGQRIVVVAATAARGQITSDSLHGSE